MGALMKYLTAVMLIITNLVSSVFTVQVLSSNTHISLNRVSQDIELLYNGSVYKTEVDTTVSFRDANTSEYIETELSVGVIGCIVASDGICYPYENLKELR